MEAFNQLNNEASSSDGFLAEISRPLNDALKPWNVEINLSVAPISPETITKYLFNYSFSDQNLANTSFGLDRFGHGFQRAVIFELIQLAANIQKKTILGVCDIHILQKLFVVQFDAVLRVSAHLDGSRTIMICFIGAFPSGDFLCIFEPLSGSITDTKESIDTVLI
jgi:hypothetical protein